MAYKAPWKGGASVHPYPLLLWDLFWQNTSPLELIPYIQTSAIPTCIRLSIEHQVPPAIFIEVPDTSGEKAGRGFILFSQRASCLAWVGDTGNKNANEFQILINARKERCRVMKSVSLYPVLFLHNYLLQLFTLIKVIVFSQHSAWKSRHSINSRWMNEDGSTLSELAYSIHSWNSLSPRCPLGLG